MLYVGETKQNGNKVKSWNYPACTRLVFATGVKWRRPVTNFHSKWLNRPSLKLIWLKCKTICTWFHSFYCLHPPKRQRAFKLVGRVNKGRRLRTPKTSLELRRFTHLPFLIDVLRCTYECLSWMRRTSALWLAGTGKTPREPTTIRTLLQIFQRTGTTRRGVFYTAPKNRGKLMPVFRFYMSSNSFCSSSDFGVSQGGRYNLLRILTNERMAASQICLPVAQIKVLNTWPVSWWLTCSNEGWLTIWGQRRRDVCQSSDWANISSRHTGSYLPLTHGPSNQQIIALLDVLCSHFKIPMAVDLAFNRCFFVCFLFVWILSVSSQWYENPGLAQVQLPRLAGGHCEALHPGACDWAGSGKDLSPFYHWCWQTQLTNHRLAESHGCSVLQETAIKWKSR